MSNPMPDLKPGMKVTVRDGTNQVAVIVELLDDDAVDIELQDESHLTVQRDVLDPWEVFRVELREVTEHRGHVLAPSIAEAATALRQAVLAGNITHVVSQSFWDETSAYRAAPGTFDPAAVVT